MYWSFVVESTWSPPDPVRLTVDEPTMRAHLDAFASAGANMVRVVGGLVYEQDEFWDQCAQLGLMVWQDAMQATFDPPPEVSELVIREIAELLESPSGNLALTVVSGGSETLQRPEMLGIEQGEFDMPVIESFLPRAVAEHSGVPYVRASPSPPTDGDDLAIRPDTGIAHWFGVGGYLRPVSDVRSAGAGLLRNALPLGILRLLQRSNGTSARPSLLGTTPIGRRRFRATVDRRGILRMSETSMFEKCSARIPSRSDVSIPSDTWSWGGLPLQRRCCSASYSGARPIRDAPAR